MSDRWLRPGASVGGYRIEDLLRTDASGDLYRAAQPELGRTVAVLVAAEAEDSEAGRRFTEVARRMAGIEHPGLVPVYEVGVEGGRPFAVLRDVRGDRLDELLAAGPLPAERAVQIAGDVAGPLDALARAGLTPVRLDPADVVLAPEQAQLAMIPVGLGGGSSTRALAELLASMVGAPGDGLVRVVDAGRADRYPDATALADDARRVLAPAPRGRGRTGVPLVAGLLAAVAIALVLRSGGDDDRPARAQTSPANAPAGRITARIALNAEPGSVAAGEGAVWVATREGTVLRVDPERDEVVGAPIRFMPPRRGENVTVRTGAGGVFVLDGSGGRVTRIDPRAGRVTGRLRLGGTLDGATVAEGSLWVTRTARSGVGSLVRVDPRTLEAVERIAGGWAGLAFDVEVAGGAAWVMSAGSGTVFRVDLATGERRELKPNAQPLGAAVVGDRIWIPDPVDGTVTPLDVRRPELPDRVARPASPFAVTATRDAIWAASNIEPRPDSPVQLHRIDPELLRPAGRPVEVGRAFGWPVAGFGAVWQPDPTGRQLLKVVPTTPPPAPATAEPEPSGVREVRSGPLPPGEWRIGRPRPPMTFELGERGWVAVLDPGSFEMFRFDEPRGATFGAYALRQAFAGGGGVRPVRRPADVVAALRANRGVRLLGRGRAAVGGLPAARATVVVRGDERRAGRCLRACTPLFPLQQGTWVMEAPSRVRISAVAAGGGVLALIESSSPDGSFTRTEPIVETLRFESAG